MIRLEPFQLFIGFIILFGSTLLFSSRFLKSIPMSKALKKFFLLSSALMMLGLLIPRPVEAVLIVERALGSDTLRGPFGIDVAVNGSFVVFAEKHVGKIGFMGTGISTLNGIYNTTYSEFSLPGTDWSTAEPRDVILGNFSLRRGGFAGDAREKYVWFPEFVRNRIGVLNLTDGRIIEFPVPTPNSGPLNIA